VIVTLPGLVVLVLGIALMLLIDRRRGSA